MKVFTKNDGVNSLLSALTAGFKKQGRLSLEDIHVKVFQDTIDALSVSCTLSFDLMRCFIFVYNVSKTHVGGAVIWTSNVRRGWQTVSVLLKKLPNQYVPFSTRSLEVYGEVKSFTCAPNKTKLIIKADEFRGSWSYFIG